jgi:UDP-N-acetylmuramate: L-alanyl-gamma-D-glutamyl-meso-diaminopimelate ligase
MRIHLIAIGGAVMHNLAMALHNKGFRVTGSDDEVFEPSRSRLAAYGLLPETTGWDPARITSELDGVILGMHARADNPELLRAQELGLKIWSFPEYIYEQSKEKKRVVIGGSHGKTTVTSMIMHVLWYNHFQFDYMVGSQLEGFETMVKLTADAPVIILEGDEYLSSPIDLRPKFHLYHPHIAVLTGIAWDHMNVFPTFENYLAQFELFAQNIPTGGSLFWYAGDPHLERISKNCSCKTMAYESYPYTTENGRTFLVNGETKVPVPVFGRHNMENIAAARHVCNELGITDDMFYEAISSFKGAAKRQQLLAESAGKKVYLDFAHAPSKVKATLDSFRETYPGKKITACLELHTFSSLNKAFMPQYNGTMYAADRAIVYYNPEVVKHKQLPEIDKTFVSGCFQHKNLTVIDSAAALESALLNSNDADILLLMSSGNYSGLHIPEIAKSLTSPRE